MGCLDDESRSSRIIPSLVYKHLLESMIFMHDIARSGKDLLHTPFGDDHVLCRHFRHAWLQRSTELTPYDYWLWSFLNLLVYHNRPTSIGRLTWHSKRQHQTPVSHHNYRFAVQCCSEYCPLITAIIEDRKLTLWAFIFWRTSSLLCDNLLC